MQDFIKYITLYYNFENLEKYKSNITYMKSLSIFITLYK